MLTKKTAIKLNIIDFFCFAMEDIAPSLGQLITIRFKTKHNSDEIQKAMRYMLTIYPRLRSVVKKDLFLHKLRILDDNSNLDKLFNKIFKVEHNLKYNTEEFIEYRKKLFNDPYNLYEEIPIKICYLPDNDFPVLLLSIHHMICDGKGWTHLINSLLMYLNGKRPPEVPLDNPSLIPALLKAPYYKIPQLLYKSYKIQKEQSNRWKQDTVLVHKTSKSTELVEYMDMHQHISSYDYEAFTSRTRELGCSIFFFTELCYAALAMALMREPEKVEGNVIELHTVIDLRTFYEKEKPVFGNYFLNCIIRIPKECWNKPEQLIKEIKTQIYENINKIKNSQWIYNAIIIKLANLRGKKYYVKSAKSARKKGLVPLIYLYSNLGNMDMLNSHGKKSQVYDVIGTTPQHGILLTTSIIDGKTNTCLSYPADEFSRDRIKNLMQSFENALGELLGK